LVTDAEPGNAISVTLIGKDGQRYIAHALPLASLTRRRAGAAYAAAAVLFVRKVALQASFPKVIGQTFKLTPAEVRVLLGIVEVGGIPEVAAALGVANATVRSHVG